jgi:hypothetical protein
MRKPVLVALGCVVTGVLAGYFLLNPRWWSLEEFENEVTRSVPIGSTKEEVMSWGFAQPCWFAAPVTNMMGGRGFHAYIYNDTLLERLSGRHFRTQLMMVFCYFDENDRVTHFEVQYGSAPTS